MAQEREGSRLMRSLSDLNDLHPFAAGPMAGLLAVAIAVLVAPDWGTERAWPLLVTVTVGAGLGQWIRSRSLP